jgi:death-on-curing protein
VRNHPFADGNKRTVWVVARLFLADNGRALQYDPTEAVKIVEAAAAGTVKEAQLAAWFRERISRSK